MLPGKIQTASLLVKISFCFTLLYNTDKYHHIPHTSDGSRLEQFPEDGSRCAHTDVWREYWILRLIELEDLVSGNVRLCDTVFDQFFTDV